MAVTGKPKIRGPPEAGVQGQLEEHSKALSKRKSPGTSKNSVWREDFYLGSDLVLPLGWIPFQFPCLKPSAPLISSVWFPSAHLGAEWLSESHYQRPSLPCQGKALITEACRASDYMIHNTHKLCREALRKCWRGNATITQLSSGDYSDTTELFIPLATTAR